LSNNNPLAQANIIGKRVAQLGFDWPTWHGALDKVREEVAEVNAELVQPAIDDQKVKEELGDLLFSVVNLIRKLELDPEDVLNQANSKFERRFSQIEVLLGSAGLSVEDASLTQMESAWQQVKQNE